MSLNPIYAAAVLSFGLSLPSHAQTFTPQITQTVGTGSEESFFTVDFQDGTPDHSFAFGYKYDGTKTGADFLTALSSGTALSIETVTYSGLGVYPTSFTFGSHSQASPGNSYWAYFTGPDGQNWTYSDVGASSRQLSNGSWDGWSWDADYNNAAPLPVTPAAVPEASTYVSLGLLLALGGVAVRRKKRA